MCVRVFLLCMPAHMCARQVDVDIIVNAIAMLQHLYNIIFYYKLIMIVLCTRILSDNAFLSLCSFIFDVLFICYTAKTSFLSLLT